MHAYGDAASLTTRFFLPPNRPCVEPKEVVQLAERYGAPMRRRYELPADDSSRIWRFNGRGNRRAEVVFAIQDPCGKLWLHTKAHYPQNLFRLPSGGINFTEDVEAALFREIGEETGLATSVDRFVGVLEYFFHNGAAVAPFASYVFLLHSEGGNPCPNDDEGITAFRLIDPNQLPVVARELRRLPAGRNVWGAWRALAMDMIYDAMAGSTYELPYWEC